jgi:hypothetical protein
VQLFFKLGLILALLWVQSDAPKPGSDLPGFTLTETPADVASILGPPSGVDDSLPNYVSWFYKQGAADEHDYGYIFCYRRSDNKLVSVTRNFEPEVAVDHLFPEDSFEVRHWPSSGKPQFSARVRTLSGNRLLIALGSAETGRPCGQLILIDPEVVRFFFPWI